MKVKELIKLLQKTDPNRLVVMSCDAEGNGYSVLAGGNEIAFNEEEGEVGLEFLTEKDEAQGYSDEDVMHDGKPAFVLCPV